MFLRILPLLAFAATIAMSANATAQPAVTGSAFSTGFNSRILSGSVSGEVDATIFGETDSGRCTGFVATTPNHRLTLTDSMPEIILELETYGLQGSLVVHGPDGVRCSGLPSPDRARIGGSWPAGSYTVFVGTVSQYDWLSYELYIAETEAELALLTVVPEIEEAYIGLLAADPTYESLWGSGEGGLGVSDGVVVGGSLEGILGAGEGGLGISGSGEGTVVGGFLGEGSLSTPATSRAPTAGTLQIDPSAATSMSLSGSFEARAEGRIEAFVLTAPETARCSGWVSMSPTYSLVLRSPASELSVAVESTANPVIISYGPMGDPGYLPMWDCVLGVDGTARISGPWPAGNHLIWVGAEALFDDEYTVTISAD